MTLQRLLAPFAAAFALAAAPALAALDAPNVVEISPRLTTSGQPTRDALAGLAAQGYEAVVYLAPPTVHDALRDEALIVARQGLVFVNLPIDFDRPSERDVATFNAVMQAFAGRKVLVHCQVNMRGSSMVFLYRSLQLKEDPRAAYESVSRVWTPNRAWRALIVQQLRAHGIDFEPL